MESTAVEVENDLLQLKVYRSPELRSTTQLVELVDDTIFTDEDNDTLQKMKSTMKRLHGMGLAAPQVGVLKRIIVLDVPGAPEVLINPRIVEYGKDKVTDLEGCLSFPGVVIRVSRSADITVAFLDEYGEQHMSSFEDLSARAIQHEVDHLHGVVMLDHVSPLVRKRALKKLDKVKKKYHLAR